MTEREPGRAWTEQVLIYAAQGPTDRTQRPRFYAIAALATMALVAAVLLAVSLIPGEPAKSPRIGTLPERAVADRDDAAVGGVLDIGDACIHINGLIGTRTVVVWPEGTTWDPDAGAVAAGATRLRSGDSFTAQGAFTDLAGALSLLDEEGDAYLHRCDEDGGVALVRSSVRLVGPLPTPLTTLEDVPTDG